MIWPRHQIGWKESEIVPFMYFFVDILRVEIGVHLADFGNRFQIRYYSFKVGVDKSENPLQTMRNSPRLAESGPPKVREHLSGSKKRGASLLKDLSLSSADG